MNRGRPQLDAMVYLKSAPLMLKHPAIFVVPLLAAVVALVVTTLSTMFTDPLGGFGGSIVTMFTQIIYMFAFGVAIIQANNIWRNARDGFDDAWEEGRRKAGGIVLAAIGFQFMIFVAGYFGQMLGSVGQIGLALVAAIFLIFTIPAAAIGGLPGSLAISGSIRAVRANPIAAILLGAVFAAVWSFVPSLVGVALLPLVGRSDVIQNLIQAAMHAIILGYLAFPFAKIYDDTAFRGFW